MSKEQILAEFDAKRDELRERCRVMSYASDMNTLLGHVISYLKQSNDSVLYGYSCLNLAKYEYGDWDDMDELIYLEAPSYDTAAVCYVGLFRTNSREVRQLVKELHDERVKIAYAKSSSGSLLPVDLVDRLLSVVRQMIERLRELPLTQL